MGDWPELTIGEVARKAGVATSSIRYYESIGPASPPLIGCMVSAVTPPTCLASWRSSESLTSAGFKLSEIKNLVQSINGTDGMAGQIRSLSSRKLEEVEALLERTRAMKGWLEVAKDCGCQTPDECALFAAPGEKPAETDLALTVVHVEGGDCRRASE